MATKKQIQDMADRLISTLDSSMESDKADAIVRDVAEGLYRDVLGIDGQIVASVKGIAHGSFGKGRRAIPIASGHKFKAKGIE